MPENNHISLHGLGFAARIGVPDAERAAPQRLAADVTLWPTGAMEGLDDDLARTVDYSAAARVCRETAERQEYRLIETLADVLCGELLSAFPLKQVRITLRKFILPDTDAVSVTLTRRRDGSSSAGSTLTGISP